MSAMPLPAPTDLTDLDASALSNLIHARQVSCREVMQAYLCLLYTSDAADE